MTDLSVFDAIVEKDSGASRSHPLYAVDETFFEKDTKESAYVLGMIYTDGCIERREDTFRFNLELIDYELVATVKATLKSEHPIHTTTRPNAGGGSTTSHYFSIPRNRLLRPLIERYPFLVAPKGHLEYPDIPEEYNCDFIRGVFDGDGSAWFGKDRRGDRNRLRTEFCGQRDYLAQIADVLARYANCRKKEPHTAPSPIGLWYIDYAIEDSVKLARYIYHKNMGNLFLKRKYDKFVQGGYEGVGQLMKNNEETTK